MNEQEMYTAINKGIPNYVIIELNTQTLLNECSSNREQLEKEFSLLKELYRTNIIKINGYTKAKEDFFDYFRLITSYKNAETKIYISPIPFINKLKRFLNVTNPSTDFNDQQLSQELLKKVEELKNITSITELKEKFPYIYADYELSINAYHQIKKYEERHSNNRTIEIVSTINRQYNIYNSSALDTDFHRFILKQSTLYRNLIVRRQFVEGYTNRSSIDFSMFQGLDKEKFELYLADKYLEKAYETEDDKIKQQCIYYIATYIRETKVSNIVIKNDQGQNISFKHIVRKYKKLLQSNPILKPIDEQRENFKGYHIKHVENHVKKYFFTNVDWQIIPPGTETELNRKVIDSLNRQYNYLTPEEKEKKILERYSTYERKRRFFDNSGYIHKLYGQNAFEGYIAYIYPNGEILMEKFFDDYENCIPTIGEAIYNIRAMYFDNLSKLSKPTLIKDKRCKRIIHAGNWEEKAQGIINHEATKETKEEVKQLLLRIQ
ncbi:MAG: hypothetical protein ACI4XM_03490 [Candidatus Coprovivens sp.]